MATTQLKAAEAAPAGKPAKSKKKLLMIVLPVVLLVGAGGYMTMGKSGGAKPKPVAGAVVPLEPITINLAGGHFLKLGLALQATKAAKEAPDGSQALDLAIEVFSNHTVTQLGTDKGRTRFKDALRTKVIDAYDDAVMDVYFTEFVTQ